MYCANSFEVDTIFPYSLYFTVFVPVLTSMPYSYDLPLNTSSIKSIPESTPRDEGNRTVVILKKK